MSYAVQNTSPPTGAQASVEDLTWGIDMTALLSSGETPTSLSSTLQDKNGNSITLTDGPSSTGNIVTQRIRAGVLSVQRAPYTLVVTMTPSSTNSVYAERLVLTVPF